MSNNSNTSNEYNIIRTLIRDLHITRNVSRPITSSTSLSPNGKLLNKQKSIKKANKSSRIFRKSYRTTSTIDEDDTNEDDDEDEISERDEGDEGRRSHSVPIFKTIKDKPIDKLTTHHSSASFNVPSVVITSPNEPIDIISSTQRRFSQLYSGLRRFSVSHTVKEIQITTFLRWNITIVILFTFFFFEIVDCENKFLLRCVLLMISNNPIDVLSYNWISFNNFVCSTKLEKTKTKNFSVELKTNAKTE